MTRTRSRTPEPEASASPEEIAEARAAEDRALLEAMQAQQEEPQERQAPTIADWFVGYTNLVERQRKDTRLGEATLVKILETDLQTHAFETQRRAQEEQDQFRKMMTEVSGGGVEADEFIGPAEDDNVVPVDFSPAEETTDAE